MLRPPPVKFPPMDHATRSTVLADSPAGRAALMLASTGRVTVTRSKSHGVIVLEVVRCAK